MDRIFIVDLTVRCTIGTDEEERAEKQDVIVNVAIETDLMRAGRSDDLKDTIDYNKLKLRILKMIEESSYRLIESLAERIASICMESPRVQAAQVRVDKPAALRFARSAGVEIYRKR